MAQSGETELMGQLRLALQALVLSKLPFVCYRVPEGKPQLKVLLQGAPQSFTSLAELDEAAGFVMVPFAVPRAAPIVLWPAAQCVNATGWAEIARLLAELAASHTHYAEQLKLVAAAPLPGTGQISEIGAGSYRQDFARFSPALRAGSYQKLVLSSYFEQESSACYVCDNLMRACAVKPELMVALVQAPQVGTWFVATPEVLLRTLPASEGAHVKLHTMALAGTMPYNAENMELSAWSRKDREEQALVTSFLTAILAQSGTYEARGPYPVKAGSVIHLRTDLTFSLPPEQGLSAILAALHPTPAVCGLPKAAALDFILAQESYERSYYTGFLGEFKCADDAGSVKTNLFVNLRTIEFLAQRGVWGPWSFRSYVGGGLLAASTEESEYAEICAKNRSVLSNLKPELYSEL